MKIILDDGTELEIPAVNKPQVFQQLLDILEALIETNEQWIANKEHEIQAIRQHVFTLRRVYDAVAAAKDANERINHMFDPVPISRDNDNQKESEND